MIAAEVNQILPKLLHDIVQKQLYIFHGWFFCLSKTSYWCVFDESERVSMGEEVHCKITH